MKASNWNSVMQAEDLPQSPPKLALRIQEASDVLSMSVDSFDRYVRPDIRTVRRNKLVLVPTQELEDWLDRNAACVGRDW